LLLFDRKPHADFDYGHNATCRRLLPPARRPVLVDAWFDVAVPRALQQWGADVFVSMEGYLSRTARVPQVTVIHDLNFEHHPEWVPARWARHYRARFPEFARLAARVVTVSGYSKEDLCQTYHLPAHRVSVIGNAAGKGLRPMGRDERVRWRAERMQGERYWLFVGSLHPRKNIEGLLAAHRAYRALGGTARLAIAGAGLFDNGSGEAREQEGVVWLGRVSREDLRGWMGAAEGLLYLPFFEGFGVPIVEAMAAGIPVVASAVTSIPEVCGDAAAALVAPDDDRGAAEAMRTMEQDEAARNAVVERGFRRAQTFDWSESARDMSNLVNEVISEKQSHG
jgi:glycosyltransferase involved in cell wall biosynthesis